MLEKIRVFAGDSSTHIAAGLFATMAHENQFFAAILVFLLTVLAINWIYKMIQKLRGCKTPHLCAVKVMEAQNDGKK